MILRAALIGGFARGYELDQIGERISQVAGREIDRSRVQVRSFLAANSRPSKDGMLRIKEKAIRKFAKLYPGAPLMRNHGLYGSDDMPIGRVFDARHRKSEDDAEELVLSFYVPKTDSGLEVVENIDSGVWSESSIHGYFSSFECSVCGKSLDPDSKEACTEHEMGQEYDGQMARVELDDPTEAPEFSLCWSGRLAGTKALSQEVPGTLALHRFMARRHTWLSEMSKQKQRSGFTWMQCVRSEPAAA